MSSTAESVIGGTAVIGRAPGHVYVRGAVGPSPGAFSGAAAQRPTAGVLRNLNVIWIDLTFHSRPLPLRRDKKTSPRTPGTRPPLRTTLRDIYRQVYGFFGSSSVIWVARTDAATSSAGFPTPAGYGASTDTRPLRM